ncbi:MAG TPA: ABC transporter permease [Acetobacteraceae bacterium]|nr:ABC transporter permease [Acetobacteraceae bacterium]
MSLNASDIDANPDWRLERFGADARLHLSGHWIARQTGLRDPATISALVAEPKPLKRIHIDTSQLGRWDSALIVFLQDLRQASANQHIELDEGSLPAAARRLLALAAETETTPSALAHHASLPEQVGRITLSVVGGMTAINTLIGETVLRGLAALGGQVWTRAGDVLDLMRETGPGALIIITIVNVLVGAILAFVGAVQLRRFGAQIYVADLVGIALTRELAAIMTAIVMAGRTGGAYAAQIATMQGNEEIDALEVFGIPVFDYLVLPRIAALVGMLPLLYGYACAVGLIGGLAVSVSILDLSATSYIEETRNAIAGRQFIIGLTKSVAFGALIALAACHIGLRAGRSAADVGRAATAAVVVGIIGIIALDAVFAVCTNALGV